MKEPSTEINILKFRRYKYILKAMFLLNLRWKLEIRSQKLARQSATTAGLPDKVQRRRACPTKCNDGGETSMVELSK